MIAYYLARDKIMRLRDILAFFLIRLPNFSPMTATKIERETASCKFRREQQQKGGLNCVRVLLDDIKRYEKISILNSFMKA